MIEQLNDILEIFISEDETTLDDFIFIQSLVDIILDIQVPLKNQRYFSRMRLTKSLDYSFRFLESLDIDYAQKLHFIFSNGHISISKRKRNEDILSSTFVKNGQKHIRLITSNTVEDSYIVTHEFFHYENMNITNPTMNFELMTEGISITSEYLQRRWFESQKHQPFCYQLNERDTLYALKVKAYKLYFELQLIYRYMKKGEVSYEDLFEIIGSQDNFYKEYAVEDYEDIVKYGDLNFQALQRNVIGGCLSSHLIDKIASDESYIDLFKELHNCCNQMTFIDTLKALGIEVLDEDLVILSNKSLKLLKEEYSKRVFSAY